MKAFKLTVTVLVTFVAAFLFAQSFNINEPQGVKYGATLPATGEFPGQMFVLIQDATDPLVHLWNHNDDAWEQIAGDAANPGTMIADAIDADQFQGDLGSAGTPTFQLCSSGADCDYGWYRSGTFSWLSSNGTGMLGVGGSGSTTRLLNFLHAEAGLSMDTTHEGLILQDTVAVSATELRTLASSPKTIVAAATGDGLLLLNAAISYRGGANIFDSVEAGEDLALRYTDGSGTIISQTIDTTDDINFGSTTDVTYFTAPLTEYAVTLGAAIVLDNVGTGELAAADLDANGDGTLEITITYIQYDPAP